MHFFDHDHTQIRSLLKVESLKSLIRKLDYIVAFEVAHKLYRSEEIYNLFFRRSLKHNLRSYREIDNGIAKPGYIGNSTIFRLRDIWNKLPLEVRNIEKLEIFKRSLGGIISN